VASLFKSLCSKGGLKTPEKKAYRLLLTLVVRLILRATRLVLLAALFAGFLTANFSAARFFTKRALIVLFLATFRFAIRFFCIMHHPVLAHIKDSFTVQVNKHCPAG